MIYNESKIIASIYMESNRYHYVGNCGDSFDDNGECIHHIFNDVSDFAKYDEMANCEELEDSNGCGMMDRDDFHSLVDISTIPPELRNNINLEYHYYNNGVLVIYDPAEDMHYFFSK